MSRWFFEKTLLCITIGLIVIAITAPVWGQETRGRINITVLDPQRAVVGGASLELVDLATNETRKAVTTSAGTYTFPNLSVGMYKLTVIAKGFRNTVYDEVTVSATKATDIETALLIGAPNEVVTVEAATPVLQTTAVAIGSTIDVKNIATLPLQGRDVGQFTRYVPGYTGTWNGLPGAAQGNNIDGVISSTSRMKFGGNSAPSVSVRLENIEEMTVQTDQMDQNQGFGMAVMQVNYTTKRGTNTWHGSFYEDLRNDWLNANTWVNNSRGVTRGRIKLNDFGGNVGGPVFKDKLFFFFSLGTSRQPGTSNRNATVLNPAGQAGNYTYVGTDGQNHTVNVLQLAKSYDPTLSGVTNSVMAGQLALINSAIAGATSTANTDLLTNAITWQSPNPQVRWFPTFRVDYTPASRWRISLSANQTKVSTPTSGSPLFPGDEFAQRVGGFRSNNVSTSLGIDWTATNTMLNAFRFGYLYPSTQNGYTTYDWGQHPEVVNWPSGMGTSSQQYSYPIPTYYPVFTIADTVNWQKGKHGLNFGFSAYREQDKYWNGAEPRRVSIGMDAGDPAYNALTNAGSYSPLPFASTTQQGTARNLYALLTARVSYITGMYKYDKASSQYIQQPLGHFDLNELAKAGGVFIQDSWRLKSNLTINMGFRWDFTAASTDLNGLYHSATTSSIWGPSGVGNLFKPGTLTGNMNPTIDEIPNPYNSWYVTPQPSLGIAWSPKFGDGFLKKILGSGNTVIRTSFSYRNYSMPYQYFWNNATDYGSFYYQFYTATARNSTAAGSFAPGSLFLGQNYPSYSLDPPAYMKSIPAASFTFNNGSQGNGINGMDYNIHQPYTMSWTIGIQQKLGQSRALEIRYNGNKSVHQWMNLNVNEVNVFENGFLQEFKNAQANLAYNATKGVTSFANLYPGAGTVALPIMTAAFTGDKNGVQTGSSFRNSSFITNLNTGGVGSMASTLTTYGSVPYFCNLVGSSFAPCARMGYTGAGAGYPINFFQANPFSTGNAVSVMTDPGWANYNGLQIEFRQQYWHGMQFNANYTYSKGLGVTLGTDWTGAYTAYTLRNLNESYGPNSSDIRHVGNVSGSVDLPMGTGKMFLNQKGALNRVFGGWNVGMIVTMRSGSVGRVTGGYQTFNNIADGGVNLNGVTRADLQSAVGVYKTSANIIQFIDPRYRTTGVGANTQYITANTTPGTYIGGFYLYGPGSVECDMSLNKSTVITERSRINFQAQFLNAFNHPTFRTVPSGSIRSSGWATSTGASNSPRVIEFRVSISF